MKKLLATLHDEDSSAGLSAKTSPSLGYKPAFSAAAQEFVPGKPFTLPNLERDVSKTSDLGTLKADAPEFVPSWGKPATAAAVAGGVLPLPTSVVDVNRNVKVIDKKVWWYRDPAGVFRGPFSTTEMRAWSDKGYFSGGLEIALSDRGPYLPLSAVYPSPERPFWKSIEPREFATRMRQHILATRNTMNDVT